MIKLYILAHAAYAYASTRPNQVGVTDIDSIAQLCSAQDIACSVQAGRRYALTFGTAIAPDVEVGDLLADLRAAGHTALADRAQHALATLELSDTVSESAFVLYTVSERTWVAVEQRAHVERGDPSPKDALSAKAAFLDALVDAVSSSLFPKAVHKNDLSELSQTPVFTGYLAALHALR